MPPGPRRQIDEEINGLKADQFRLIETKRESGLVLSKKSQDRARWSVWKWLEASEYIQTQRAFTADNANEVVSFLQVKRATLQYAFLHNQALAFDVILLGVVS